MLTDKKRAVYSAIRRHHVETGDMPSLEQIRKRAGLISVDGVRMALNALEADGLIVRRLAGGFDLCRVPPHSAIATLGPEDYARLRRAATLCGQDTGDYAAALIRAGLAQGAAA